MHQEEKELKSEERRGEKVVLHKKEGGLKVHINKKRGEKGQERGGAGCRREEGVCL